MEIKGNHDKIIIFLLVIIVVLLVAGVVLFNPFKSDSMISITSAGELTQADELSILLTDANSHPISNQTINIYITDSTGAVTQKSVVTNGDGVATLSLSDLASGQYSVNATYDGSRTFKSSIAFQRLSINPKITESISTDPVVDAPYHQGFTPSYREGPLVYGYKGDRFGFVTPAGNFFEMK